MISKVKKEEVLGKEGKKFLRTFKILLKQRDRIDQQMIKLEGRVLKVLDKNKKSTHGRKKYVKRSGNKLILVDAIRIAMVLGKGMTMKEILASLDKKRIYRTKSKYLYTMANNKLNRDKSIEKVSRGVFLLTSLPKETGSKKRGRPRKAS